METDLIVLTDLCGGRKVMHTLWWAFDRGQSVPLTWGEGVGGAPGALWAVGVWAAP